MSIFPLPVFEADAEPRHREMPSTDGDVYERLEPPRTIVVRFGHMSFIGEYKYEGDAKPGCGSKLVARTHRGTELVEMLTTTCDNSGCSKSVTRQEMLEYIDQSGGRDFPFSTQGRVIRVAALEDLNKQSALDEVRRESVMVCRELIGELELGMQIVAAEPILGEELMTFYYMADERVDFRELVRRLAARFKTRIEMRQVGARDEARLVADYERCGQYCCCKNFLKVLRPVSMKSAKVQKATLDPLKISGRCGRLMCCLRYEDQTYKELKATLPRKRSRVGTVEGPGIVIDTKILVQLALVRLEHDDREIAVPIEELMDPESCPPPGSREAPIEDPLSGLPPVEEIEPRPEQRKRRRRRRKGAEAPAEGERAPAGERDKPADAPPKRRRRRRRGGAAPAAGGGGGTGGNGEQAGPTRAPGASDGAEGGGSKRRRRRRRRRGPGGGGGGGGGGEGQ